MRISDWSSDVCSSDLELADPFATYLGWTVPWDAPLTLIGDSADDVVAARRQLARIGIDHMAAAVGQPVELASGGTPSYRRADRKTRGSGKSGVVRVDLGGRRILK